jgi:hypothetical protein
VLQNDCRGLLVLLGISTADLEVSQLVGVLAGRDDVQEITQLLLLEVLLGQVLQVSLGKGKLSLDVDLGLLAGDDDLGTEVASLVVDLDAVVEELLEGDGVEDLVLNGVAAVNGELGDSLLDRLLDNLLQL